MHYVYVLRSTSDDGFYIGYSTNLRKEFKQHVQGDSFATSYRGPWKLIYYAAYLERDDALGRERYLKSGSGRKFLKTQLRHYLDKRPLAREHRFYAKESARLRTEEDVERSTFKSESLREQ